MTGPIILSSPLYGWLSALEAVPDPVFSGRLMGDGVAIDPLGQRLYAPCDAQVLTLHDGRHAITLAGEGGVELLIHIGIDTVALGGRGLRPLVAAGDHVTRGQPLIDFDLDGLALSAPSLLTPIVVTNGDSFRISGPQANRLVNVGDPLLTLEPTAAAISSAPAADGLRVTRRLVVPLPHGIHARPAARVADLARGFSAESWLAKDGREGRTRSPVALMGLGIRLNDTIEVRANGTDASAAVAAIAALIESGIGEGGEGVKHPLSSAAFSTVRSTPHGALAGTSPAPGLAIGTARWLRAEDIAVDSAGEEPALERARLDHALSALRERFVAGSRLGSIAEAHRAMLEDPDLIDAAARAIGDGASAALAWRIACRAQAAELSASADHRIAERAGDLRDLERQVIAAITGQQTAPESFAPDTILLADDLLPSQVAALDGNVVALAIERGGPTSHVAILAATFGLPTVVAIGASLQSVPDGAAVIVDADAGLLYVDPAPDRLATTAAEVARRAEARVAAVAAAADLAQTRDGTRIEAFANLGSVEDARIAIENGAEGSGLLRTEFLFLDRADAPGVAEQAAVYQAVADEFVGRPLIVRLLDVGGDKPASYLPIAAEENPALGLRGIRVGLARPDLLDDQLRAILSVQPIGQCRIMVPMVASTAELTAVRDRVEVIRAELNITERVEIGIMVETPAAAVTAATLARNADFLSVGTNDLTQYALAMDRANPAVAGDVDGLHPAVLGLIALTVKGATQHRRWVGVCGGLASDPLAVPLLIGLGVTELSATPRFVPELKALIRRLDRGKCHAHAQQALGLESAGAVRDLARRFEQEIVA